ncbi:MAG: hypothetical protein HY708_07565 [Ignavibacteriae bacterium]|nr:hypothetical protein [Ignavibacteriota bacterium]
MRPVIICIVFVFLTATCAAQTSSNAPESSEVAASRIGILGGMGVSYVNAQDIVDRVNSSSGVAARVAEFKAAIEFFGGITIPVTPDWVLKLEYAYLLGSYTVNNSFFNSEFQFVVHMPMIIGQYVLVDGGVYNVKVGAGGGYHFGSYSEKFATVDDRFSGKGLGAVMDLEANTAFGESFYAYLGANLRWEFIGDLTNASGKSPGGVAASSATTLQFFSIGARLGFTFYL